MLRNLCACLDGGCGVVERAREAAGSGATTTRSSETAGELGIDRQRARALSRSNSVNARASADPGPRLTALCARVGR
eukprot:scaffold1744_cov129-Isochrysis_galbana.AAC.12